MTVQEKYEERLNRVNTAVALKEPDRLPVCPYFSSAALQLEGAETADLFYDFPRAEAAILRFYEKHPLCDAHLFDNYTSGAANEIGKPTMIDWPGRPGSKVTRNSSHQVMENAYLQPEEYDELLSDYTGFMLRKYIPRAYAGIGDLSAMEINPSILLGTSPLASLGAPGIAEAFAKLAEIGRLEAECWDATLATYEKLDAIGMPGFSDGISEVPFDILGDYYRGTLGLFDDQIEYEDKILAVCEMFADQQIRFLQYYRDVEGGVRRVFVPMHKAMDGFMSPKQFEQLYMRPFLRVIDEMIDMNVTPILYTEGRYNTRLEQLAEMLPKGKCIVHFETVDIARAKELFAGTACITGNLPIYLMQFGTPDQVREETKKLLDICMPGGGYIFDFNALLENIEPEKEANVDALFETLELYGKY